MDTGKRYLILRDINGNLDMSKKRVSGMSARDDGTTYGPIRTLRTDKLIVYGMSTNHNTEATMNEHITLHLVQKDGTNKKINAAEVANMFGSDFVCSVMENGSSKNGMGTFYARRGLIK